MKKSPYFIFLASLLMLVLSFHNRVDKSEPSQKIIIRVAEKYNHEYAYNEEGVLLYALTTSAVSGLDSGTLVQKIIFDSTGIVRDVFLITDTKIDDQGYISYNDQSVRFDAERNLVSYRFTRDFKTIDSRIYSRSKGKYFKN